MRRKRGETSTEAQGCLGALRDPNADEGHEALCRLRQTVEAVVMVPGQVEVFRGEILLQLADPDGARDREDDR